MDINDLRSLATVLCMIGFLSVVVWAYTPSRKSYFDKAAKLPFEDSSDREQSHE
jgi:cytochrome c oxidase cbb3-type subunit 4